MMDIKQMMDEQVKRWLTKRIFVVLAMLVLSCAGNIGLVYAVVALTKDQHTGDLKIDMLRQRLRDASAVVSSSNKLCNASAELQDCSTPVHCACKDFCRGACFACGCAPCTAATWSFPGGGALCTDPGPLGTGLLCAVDPISRTPTSDACCAVNGTYCTLPPGSCNCSMFSAAKPALFQPLPRKFDERTLTCIEAAG